VSRIYPRGEVRVFGVREGRSEEFPDGLGGGRPELLPAAGMAICERRIGGGMLRLGMVW